MGYVNDINYVNEMNYVNVLSHLNNKNFVNDMSYVKKYELRYELHKLYGYSHESLKIIFVQYIRMNLRNQKYKN